MNTADHCATLPSSKWCYCWWLSVAVAGADLLQCLLWAVPSLLSAAVHTAANVGRPLRLVLWTLPTLPSLRSPARQQHCAYHCLLIWVVSSLFRFVLWYWYRSGSSWWMKKVWGPASSWGKWHVQWTLSKINRHSSWQLHFYSTTGTHMPYGITVHPAVWHFCLHPSKACTRLCDPKGMQAEFI